MSERRSAGERSRDPDRTSLRDELLLAWVHIGVLWAFAFSKPLFDVLADSPDFFVARGNTGGDIVLFALGITLLPPTALVGIELLFFRWPRARRLIHLAIVAALVASLALQLLDGLADGPALVLVLAAAALGAGGALIYARVAASRSVLTVLGPTPVLFLVLFLFFSGVSKLILPQGEGGEAVAAVAGNTPVVVVVLDEFAGYSIRDGEGRIDASRYPNFAALARDATWYRNATTITDGTTHAVPAILSGRVPEKEDLPIVSDYPQNLFTILGGNYALNVNERATALCPERLCGAAPRGSIKGRLRALADDLSLVSLHLLVPDDLDDRLAPVDQTFGGFRHAADTDASGAKPSGSQAAPDAGIPSAAFQDRTGQWQRSMAKVDSSPRRPTFTFLHVLLPHMPWVRLPSGQEYATAGPDVPGVENDSWGKDRLQTQQGQERFLLQAGYVDRLVGELVRTLRRRGLYDRSVLVITADHGVSFQPGRPRRQITPETLPDIAPVPLFVKLPGQRAGRVDDRMARTVDIVPTIADQLKIRLEDPVDGHSLLRPARRPERVTVSAAHAATVSVSFAEFKRERDRQARRMIDVFGAGHGWARVFRPDGDLAGEIGSAATDLPAGAPSGTHIELDAPGLFTSIAPRSELIPAFVTGVLTGRVDPGDRFAVALNGRIAGVGSAYSADPDIRLGVLVPPELLRPGANRVDVFSVQGHGPATRLARVPRTDTVLEAKLARRNGKDVIQESSGGTISVTRGAISGSVDALTARGRIVTTSGWAIDEARKRPVDRLLVFAGGRLVASGRPSISRADIAQKFGPTYVRSGFQLSGVDAESGDADTSAVRIFAVSGQRASELNTSGAASNG